MIMPYKNKHPKIHPSVFVAPGAHIVGDVTIGAGSSVWYGAVLRGDMDKIRIGKNTNIQDGAVLHTDHGKPCILKDNVIVGHQAVVHACTIENSVLVGIGSRVLNGARVGAFSLIGAGALIKENAVIPPYSLVLGLPGRVMRKLTPKETADRLPHARRYTALAKEYKKYLG